VSLTSMRNTNTRGGGYWGGAEAGGGALTCMRKTNTRGEGEAGEGCTHLHEEDEHKRRRGRQGGVHSLA